ncbi:PVC-type heme-binding CxxCH protein [Natrialbaceae archaeon A-arb3/5]
MANQDDSGSMELDRRRFMQATGVGVAGLTAGNIVQGQYEASWDDPDDVLEVLYLGGVEDGAAHYSEDLVQVLAPYLLEHGIKVHYTERQDDLNHETLANYDAVMLYGNRLEPTEEQIDALEAFVEDGGGFVPVHSASASFGAMDGNPDGLAERFTNLVGGGFDWHGHETMTTDRIEPDHPVFEGTEEIEAFEETYRHHNLADDIEVLAHGAGGDYEEDEEEPFTWVREQGDGRVFYTAWGHDDGVWVETGFQQLLENGIRWASGNEDSIGSHPELDDVSYSHVEDEYGHDEVPYYQGDAPDEVSTDNDGVWDLVQDPMSVSDSLAHTVTPAEFEMEYFVSEDQYSEYAEGQILDMTFDAAGRCWVSITQDYPNDGGDGNDAILICEDTDGDGVADDFTVFKDGLSIPHSLIPYQDGVISAEVGVEEDGRVVYHGDEDGDDVADVEDVLFTGYGTGDTHAGLNQLHYGVDNWIYGVVGYEGLSTDYGGESHSFNQDLFRFKPDGSEMEFVGSGASNMAGVKTNEEGLVFCSSATAGSDVTTYAAIPDSYYEYIDGYNGRTTVDIRGENLSRTDNTNRILPINDRYRQVDQQDGFTAVTDQEFYTAREFPEQYWNKTSFVGEGTGQLLATFYLEQDGANYEAVNHHNLVTSNDEWVSPTYVNTGPDGMVWMIDFYNFVFQHNPTPSGYDNGAGNAYQTNKRDHEHSRLYRVTTGDDVDLHPRDLSDASPEELVDALTDDNKFWRRTAQRLLIERGETDVVDDLVDLVQDESTDEIGLNPGAIHALWTLQGLGWHTDDDDDTLTHYDPSELDDVDDDVDHVIRWQGDAEGETAAAASASDVNTAETDVIDAIHGALDHDSAGVRLNAVRVLPDDEATRDAILDHNLLEDEDGRVQMWALLKLAETPTSDDTGAAIFEMIDDDDHLDDDLLVDAATVAGATHAAGFIDAYHDEYGDPDEEVEGVNILDNGDISNVDEPEPDEWETVDFDGDFEHFYTDEESYTGDRSIGITSDDGTDAGWTVEVPVEPDTDYTLSAYIKTEDVETADSAPDWAPEGAPFGACFNIEELANDEGLDEEAITEDVTGTEDWTEVTLEFNSLDYDSLEVNALFGAYASDASGTVWYDNVSVVEDGDDENLVPNGDLADGDVELSVSGWEESGFIDDDMAEWGISDTEAYEGDRSLMLSADENADFGWTTSVEVEPDTDYTLSAQIKTEDVVPSDDEEEWMPEGAPYGAVLNIEELANDEGMGEEAITEDVTGTEEWTEVTLEFNSQDYDELEINALLGGYGGATGTAWFDDVQVIDPDGEEEEEAPNLIENPTFEGGDLPDGWFTMTHGGDDPEYTRDEEETYSGDYSLRVDADSQTDFSISTDIDTEPNTEYEHGGYIKTENLDADDGYGAAFNVHLLGEQTLTDTIDDEETDGWVEVSGTFTSDSQEETFNCLIGGWGTSSGTVWWDEPYVRALEDVGEGIDAVYARIENHHDGDDDENGEPEPPAEAIDPADTIELEGSHDDDGWYGLGPASIEDEANPTLTLIEGEEYTLEWTNGDDMLHWFEIGDEPSPTSGDLAESDQEGTEGETVTLEFTATSEMAGYVCPPHPDTMSGEIDVVDDDE